MHTLYLFGPYRLEPALRTLYRDGVAVKLGSRAFDILVMLVERQGAVVTPRELMSVAWQGLVVGESNVRVQIANLRQALGNAREGARYIASIPGRGYMFLATVERLTDARARGETGPTWLGKTWSWRWVGPAM
ncbi:DNA-binding winged helix-turn-helix (wHTH) domain-containing protein [Luteibacter sp. UNCMF331Sha3.1]|uniref:winged helix-turn-helix domain-containing protein n=1 Tax=Luteibacter sp. UNCMF331Sha3.1 TaxID=1502760 RepID=UPI0008B8B5CA|nr:transcriptional regulator [Luteibacter sp. UNCMF331Sha3.1]SEN20453.1 DNA-binding winged helix-turn-helix (wHTH) domain-containing protein [Luteibacter sp. UNCMF331Sha3.1]